VRWSFLLAFLTCLACSAQQPSKAPYQVQVPYGKSVEPNVQETIIPNGREVLPKILNGCGVTRIRDIPTSDYVVTFRFDLDERSEKKTLSCLRGRLPQGVALEKSVLP
jgi:hypothetical protein